MLTYLDHAFQHSNLFSEDSDLGRPLHFDQMSALSFGNTSIQHRGGIGNLSPMLVDSVVKCPNRFAKHSSRLVRVGQQ